MTTSSMLITKREQWLLSRLKELSHAEVVVFVQNGIIVRIEKVTGSEKPPLDS